MGKTGGGPGTNQYQVRGRTKRAPAAPTGTLIDQVSAAPLRRPCGEVWNSKCKKLVTGPDWSHGNHPTVRRQQAVAQDPSTDPELLAVLSRSTSTSVRARVARNTSADSATQERLSRDDNAWIQMEIADNPMADPQVLERLSQSEFDPVRNAVASNHRTNPGTLARLVTDPSADVRHSALYNPFLPEHLRALGSILG